MKLNRPLGCLCWEAWKIMRVEVKPIKEVKQDNVGLANAW